ncbi:MAG: hypothetical protein ACK4VK_02220 [Aquificaceae bacterium]
MIKVIDIKDKGEFEEGLKKGGWKRGSFDGKEGFIKEEEKWLWVCLIYNSSAQFISFPLEESSKVHSEGVKRLLEEIKALSERLDFTTFGRIECG